MGDVVRKGVRVDSATHVVILRPRGFSWLLVIASFSLGFAGLWKLHWRWESDLFHSVVKEKELKYRDNWRTNEIAFVKDKKMVFLAISKGKHFSQTETIFLFIWGVYCQQMFNFHKQLIFGKLKIIFICVKTPCILLQWWSNHSHEVSSNARTGLLDSFKENMDVCVGECREEGNCMYGHRMAIRDKIPLRQVTKHAKIILMLYTSVTNNPYFLSPNPTSKKKFPFRKHPCRSRGSWQRLLPLLPEAV